MKERFRNLIELLSLRNMWDDQEEEDWEDYDRKEEYVSGGEEYADDTLERAGIRTEVLYMVIAGLVILAVFAYTVMSRRHLYTGYTLTDSYEAEDIVGTRYEKLGSGFVKYGSDGVTYVSGRNETQWSTAYTIETPVTSICGDTMLIYEQQGYTVEVLDSAGVLGSYQTDFPIMRAEVARNGVAALMLKDGNDARIRLTSTDGTALAEVKTTLEDQGYPLAMDLSSDALNLMVSLARIGSGTVDSTIVFYNFSSAAQSDDSHLVSSAEYRDEIFPYVCYVTDKIPVAVGDSGFVTFTSSKHPAEKKSVHIAGEILSLFHNEEYIGFVLASNSATERYCMQVYSYSGKETANRTFSGGYSEVKMDSGEILFNDSGHIMAFTPTGVARLDTDCDRQITEFVKIPGFRRYALLTNSGIYRIRAE